MAGGSGRPKIFEMFGRTCRTPQTKNLSDCRTSSFSAGAYNLGNCRAPKKLGPARATWPQVARHFIEVYNKLWRSVPIACIYIYIYASKIACDQKMVTSSAAMINIAVDNHQFLSA